MAAPIGKGPPRKPGASLTGKLMVDTVRGRIRVRKWPENHPLIDGSPRAEAASRFAAANRLAKVQHAAFQRTAIEATHGTPWYPRDPFLAFSFGRAVGFVLPDGSQIHSMANRNDVSKSLDVLSAVPGKILKRGSHWWEGVDPPPAAGTWQLLQRTTVTSPISHVPCNDLQGAAEVMVIAVNTTAAASAFRRVQVAIGDPPVYKTSLGDYFEISTAGVLTNVTQATVMATASAAARTVVFAIPLTTITGYKAVVHPQNPSITTLIASAQAPLTGVQFYAQSGINLTGGDLWFYGR